MSDEIETTGGTSFTAGETKLLISIMSNLQGDLNVSHSPYLRQHRLCNLILSGLEGYRTDSPSFIQTSVSPENLI